MRILLAFPGLFDGIGGGQRFYHSLVRSNPEIEFYGLSNNENKNEFLPRNLHLIPVTDLHRRVHDRIALDKLREITPDIAMEGKSYDVALILDVVASLTVFEFDCVEVPDYFPFAAILPAVLEYHNIQFGKFVLSMHGTLSMGLEDNWASLGDLASLTAYESLLYRVADVRYGIGRAYVEEWAKRENKQSYIANVLDIYDGLRGGRRFARTHSGGKLPDLCFVGRQEKWKGPDLFLDFCSRLPRELFGRVRFLGPSVEVGGRNSADVLQTMAANRSLKFEHQVIEPDEMGERLRQDRMVVFVPSRRDTFNFVALESLLAGCPTIVSSKCGVCDFLDNALPELNYVKIDPEDIFRSYDAILETITKYDAVSEQLSARLSALEPWPYGVSLRDIYNAPADPDPVAANLMRKSVAAIMSSFETDVSASSEAELAASTEERCAAVLGGESEPAPALAAEQLRLSVAIRRLSKESWSSGSGEFRGQRVGGALPLVDTSCFYGDRVAVYRLLAEWEKQRGNELLCATYWLRVMRLGGDVPPTIFEEIQNILLRHGMEEEATAAKLIQSGTEAEVYEYLSTRSRAHSSPPPGEFAEMVNFRRQSQDPTISLIVSIYNGEAKIDTFVSGLERFTEDTKRATEVIFIDSNSPDGTRQVLLKRLKRATKRGVSALYARTAERETIQRAWNRGIGAARGRYLCFLGVDEMNRPDSLALMAAFLDRNPNIDWVQGSAVITEVNSSGSYLRDVMAYDRNFDRQAMHYLDCCYISYVGAMYRKSIHDRAGLYDDRFRGAGDTEFKNRALPVVRAHTLPETLGTFLNYQEDRTTQSPRVEVEDIRAWYLHRTPGGVRYALERQNDDEAVALFFRSLGYRKTYMSQQCTDVTYASSIAEYLSCFRTAAFAEIEQYVPGLKSLQLAYRRFDNLGAVFTGGLKGLHTLGGKLEQVWFGTSQARKVHRMLGLPGLYGIRNDNLWQQHNIRWNSTPQRFVVEPPVDYDDLAGTQDLAEVLSSCGAQHTAVDIDTAMARGSMHQIRRLFHLNSLDFLIDAPGLTSSQASAFLTHAFGLTNSEFSFLVRGVDPEALTNFGDLNVFGTGPIQTARPVIAAAKVILMPVFDPTDSGAELQYLIQLFLHMKPVVITEAMARNFVTRFSACLGEIPVARNVKEMATYGERLARDATARAQCVAETVRIARWLMDKGSIHVSDHVGFDSVSSRPEWTPRIAAFNRLMWRFANGEELELSCLDHVLDTVDIEEYRATCEKLFTRYFSAKDAHILSYSEFRRTVVSECTRVPPSFDKFAELLEFRKQQAVRTEHHMGLHST